MKRNSDDFPDLRSPEYDFSQESQDFRERLRARLLGREGDDKVIPLFDEDLEKLNAAGQEPPVKPKGARHE